MGRKLKGSYVNLSEADRTKIRELVEHAQGTARLASWLKVHEKTVLNWLSGKSARFRTEGRQRIEALYASCFQVAATVHSSQEPTLRSVFNRMRDIGAPHEVMAELALMIVESE